MTTEDIIHAINQIYSFEDLETIESAAESQYRQLLLKDNEVYRTYTLALREQIPVKLSRQVVRCLQSLDPSFDYGEMIHPEDLRDDLYKRLDQRTKELSDLDLAAGKPPEIYGLDNLTRQVTQMTGRCCGRGSLEVIDDTLQYLDKTIAETKKKLEKPSHAHSI
jgi:hypothetical protein